MAHTKKGRKVALVAGLALVVLSVVRTRFSTTADSALVRRALADDRRALEALVLKYQKKAYALSAPSAPVLTPLMISSRTRS